MDIEKKQIARLVRIVALLKENQYPNSASLLSEMSRCNLSCSKDTIKRDIKVLRTEFNAPIEYDFKKNGYFLTNLDWEFSYVSQKEKKSPNPNTRLSSSSNETNQTSSPEETSAVSTSMKSSERTTIIFHSIIGLLIFLVISFGYYFAYSKLKLNNLEYGLMAYKEKRFSEAVSYFQKAALEGSPYAQFMLGECYYNGYGVKTDFQEAYNWYYKSNENDFDEAGKRIVDLFIDTDNLTIEKTEAFEMCGREAEKGYSNAQYKLALLFEQNSEQEFAFKWFKSAAEQGHPDAQNRLGDCYENAKGVGQDFKEAYYWYKEAAAQGIKNAQQAMKRVKPAETKAEQDIAHIKETNSKNNATISSKNTNDSSRRKTTVLSSSDPWDPLTWRREEEKDEAKYGYDKALYKCRRCGMRSFDPLDDGVRGVNGYCIDCVRYLLL